MEWPGSAVQLHRILLSQSETSHFIRNMPTSQFTSCFPMVSPSPRAAFDRTGREPTSKAEEGMAPRVKIH